MIGGQQLKMSSQVSPEQNIFMIKKELEACEIECKETKNIVRALENYRDIEERLKKEIRARKKAESKAAATAKAAQAQTTKLRQAEAEVALLRSACADLRATCEQREPLSRIESDRGRACSPVPHFAALGLRACRSLGDTFPTPAAALRPRAKWREWSASRTKDTRDGPPSGDPGLGSALAKWWSSPPTPPPASTPREAASRDDDIWSRSSLAKWWSPPTPAVALRPPEATLTYEDSVGTPVPPEADPPPCGSLGPRGRCVWPVPQEADPPPCGSLHTAGAAPACDTITKYVKHTTGVGTDKKEAETSMLKEYFTQHRCLDDPPNPLERMLTDLSAKVEKLERSQRSFDAKVKKKKPVTLFRTRKKSSVAKVKKGKVATKAEF